MTASGSGEAVKTGTVAQQIDTTLKTEELLHVPLEQVEVEKQVRSAIDMDADAFKGLMASIAEQGVIEPVLVMRSEGGYRLLSGERRFLASRQLGLPTIPVRILENISGPSGVISIQIIENMQREDLNPVDQANAVLDYLKALHPELDLGGVISAMITLARAPGRVESKLAASLAASVKMSGKSLTTIRNLMSILRLPAEIQAAIADGRVPATHGTLFAANLDHPALIKVFNDYLAKPMTYDQLKMRFVQEPKTDKPKADRKRQTINTLRANLKSVKTMLEVNVVKVAADDMTALLADLQSLVTAVQAEMERQANEAAQIAAAKEAAVFNKAVQAADAQRAQETAAADSGTTAGNGVANPPPGDSTAGTAPPTETAPTETIAAEAAATEVAAPQPTTTQKKTKKKKKVLL